MSKYLIKVEESENCNPEFELDKGILKGIEADGFIIIAFNKDGAVASEVFHGVSIDLIKDYLREETDGACYIREACAIAEGYIRAMEMKKEHTIKEIADNILKHLGNMLNEES